MEETDLGLEHLEEELQFIELNFNDVADYMKRRGYSDYRETKKDFRGISKSEGDFIYYIQQTGKENKLLVGIMSLNPRRKLNPAVTDFGKKKIEEIVKVISEEFGYNILSA